MTYEEVQTPHAIAEVLGSRLKQERLNQNLTQSDVAEKVGITRKSLINAEKGHVSLEHFAAIVQALGLTSQLDMFLPERPISPIQLMKLQGKKRQRASLSASTRDRQNTSIQRRERFGLVEHRAIGLDSFSVVPLRFSGEKRTAKPIVFLTQADVVVV